MSENFAWLTPSHGVMLALLVFFAIAHSGLAALRNWGEKAKLAQGPIESCLLW